MHRLNIKKAVKYGMIKHKGSIQEKFEILKKVGIQGVDMDSPGGANIKEAVEAAAATGIVMHGVVDSTHWAKRFSDAKPEVRAQAVADLTTALKDAKGYGATTVLVVPGKVTNKETENFEQAWERSQAEIAKCIPLSKELGVKIAIENVWNDFLMKPEQMLKFVDEFKSEQVGVYFDIGNHVKYGPPSDWIRLLGKRILKLDVKGYHRQKGWVAIFEGDEDWPEVRKALAEIGYAGWATAEVGGGGEDVLRDISQRMDKAFALA